MKKIKNDLLARNASCSSWVGWACQTSNVLFGTTMRGAGSRQNGDHFIIDYIYNICLVLGVLPEEGSEQQSSIYGRWWPECL